jgi:hypothetical protein
MRRTSRPQQFAVLAAGACAVLGVAIGFWPVSVTVIGDVSYSCGSGFVHSQHTWKVDTRSMAGLQQSGGRSRVTPKRACPSRIYAHRDLGYALIAFAAAAYMVLWATTAFDPALTPHSRGRARSRRPVGGVRATVAAQRPVIVRRHSR